MQIYTKIFIGMAAGLILGIFAGPNSVVAPKDVVHAEDGSVLPLHLAPSLQAKRLVLPAGVPAQLQVIGEVQSPRGVRFYHLSFTPGACHKLTLGSDARRVEVYLPMASPFKPVWSWGLTILRVLEPVGAIFMRLIKMLIVPLVFCSLLVGVASLGDVRQLGRLGGKTLGFFLATTILAITLGVVTANIVQPGRFISEDDKQALAANYSSAASSAAKRGSDKPSAAQNIINIVPKNPLAAMSAKQPNMLQIIFFALILGVGCTLVPGRKTKQLVSLLDKVNDAMTMMVHMSMAVAPYGVFALVAKVVGTSGWSVLAALTIYSLVVIGGLFLHAIVVYTGAVCWVAKVPALGFWKVIRPAQLISFSTSSSAVALPLAMETAKENLGVSHHVSSFVLPLGTTINMDGTALYQGVAALFIAQVFGIDLTLGAQLNIILTATLASIGTAGVPGVGMITLAMVLTSVGVPTIGVALILGVDRIIDMFRSSVNTTGNLAAAVVIAASEGETPRILLPGADAARADAGIEGRLDVPQHAYVPGDDTPDDDTPDDDTPDDDDSQNESKR
ncbi:MAG: dicarboxylate/amino acid:cation symporter [Deltaproteobacteria bacterium]|nr:dicarboxylate/amino acid:cation symporter [Deltaproteobacteria bacterium]